MSESPAEYVEELRAQNRALRGSLLHLVQEKQTLLEHIARQDIYIKELLRINGRAAHDWEPARPGLSDID